MTKPTHALQRRASQQGLTMVELLVALALGGLIALAAVAALTVSRQGFIAVDASAQLRDNARFATSIIRRLATQAAFKDFKYASTSASSAFRMGSSTTSLAEPNIKGFNNAAYDVELVKGATNSVTTTGVNNSDMLVVRYQMGTVTKTDGTEGPDQTMIDCSGATSTALATSESERMVSVFYVGTDQGEPTLMCAWFDGTNWNQQPLVQGVESLQLLYGVDGVTAGAAPTASANRDTAPEQYLRADQMVASTTVATNENWQRVRSIRVGMVMRGPPGSSSERTVPAQYPLGPQGLMNSTNDPGSVLSSQSDGRLRQTTSFTIHLRNAAIPRQDAT